MKIYVVTHKKMDFDLPVDYVPFQVNTVNSEIFYEFNDAVGSKQISVKNPYYCELTAAYWIWQNVIDENIIGLMHYRRFLTKNMFSVSPKYYLNRHNIEKILQRYDFIATKCFKFKQTVKEVMFDGVREHDFELLRQVILDQYPDYIDVFDKVFDGHKTYLCNIFITKKEQWDAYYSWLFSIFDKLEPLVDMTDYTEREKRLYGFLSERLFTVYIVKNGLKVKSYPLSISGLSLWRRLKQKIKNVIK